MNVKQMKVSDLKPYTNNPRNNDDAVDAVASSIKEFGFKVPIIIDKQNEIIAGHTRLKAAQKIGLESVPVVIADDLTDEQIKAFRLADNKTAELAGWNYEMLDQELFNIKNLDMSQFGFNMDESFSADIDDFFADAEEKEKKEKEVTCPHCGKVFKL